MTSWKHDGIIGPPASNLHASFSCPYPDPSISAVRIANDSPYGLSGSVWGADQDRAADVARRIRTGTTNVNMFTLDMGSPFGGFKDSGVGRELGPEGLSAYLQPQTIAHAAQA